MRILPHGQQAPKLSPVEKQQQVFRAQLNGLRTKLDSQLLTNNLMKADVARQCCAKLDGMSHEQRQQYITETWGPLYLERAMPLLMQIEQTEAAIAAFNAQNTLVQQPIPPSQEALSQQPVPPATP